jgi:hypothetical protein
VSEVITEVEGHTGLLVRTGHDQFEFAHKSLQEYLPTEYIVRLPAIPSVLTTLPNEIAITVAISSNPSAYLLGLTEVVRQLTVPKEFSDVFLDRLAMEVPDFGRNAHAALGLELIS